MLSFSLKRTLCLGACAISLIAVPVIANAEDAVVPPAAEATQPAKAEVVKEKAHAKVKAAKKAHKKKAAVKKVEAKKDVAPVEGADGQTNAPAAQ